MLENVNWGSIATNVASAAAGVAVASYKFGRVVKVDRRNDQTVEFAESHYQKIIAGYVAQLALKDEALMKKDLEIVRLQFKIDQIEERKDKIVSRHYRGKDIFQQTDVLGTASASAENRQ